MIEEKKFFEIPKNLRIKEILDVFGEFILYTAFKRDSNVLCIVWRDYLSEMDARIPPRVVGVQNNDPVFWFRDNNGWNIVCIGDKEILRVPVMICEVSFVDDDIIYVIEDRHELYRREYIMWGRKKYTRDNSRMFCNVWNPLIFKKAPLYIGKIKNLSEESVVLGHEKSKTWKKVEKLQIMNDEHYLYAAKNFRGEWFFVVNKHVSNAYEGVSFLSHAKDNPLAVVKVGDKHHVVWGYKNYKDYFQVSNPFVDKDDSVIYLARNNKEKIFPVVDDTELKHLSYYDIWDPSLTSEGDVKLLFCAQESLTSKRFVVRDGQEEEQGYDFVSSPKIIGKGDLVYIAKRKKKKFVVWNGDELWPNKRVHLLKELKNKPLFVGKGEHDFFVGWGHDTSKRYDDYFVTEDNVPQVYGVRGNEFFQLSFE
jgi:hypothetical protein